MYRPSAFAVDDISVLHDIIRKRVFATLVTSIDGAITFAYTPVVLDANDGAHGSIHFHLAFGNPLVKLEDGARVSMSLIALDAYVSPDWYRKILTVPTWNYIALEGEGALRRMSREQLRELVVDLSAQEEAKLLPKMPWLIDKVPAQRVEVLLNGIAGFSLPLDRLQGKFKLSQDKSREDIEGVIAGLETRGDTASGAVAKAMRSAVEAKASP